GGYSAMTKLTHREMDKVCARLRDLMVLLAVLFMAAIIIGFFFCCAQGHVAERPALNAVFNTLRRDGGPACCGATEAERIADPDWETKDGHYRVKIEGQWFDVPDGAVISAPNRFGPALVWPNRYGYERKVYAIRCFIPGAGM